METFLRQLTQHQGLTEVPSALQAVVAIGLAFVLSLLIVYTYRKTHRGPSYSQSYAQTLVLMSVVTAVIMMIIGSNIARAFSLVGALSIIRFRSAVKDPRDVGFVFFAMAVGMAVGTQFYVIGLLLTSMMCGIAFFMTTFDIGAKPFTDRVLKVVADAGPDPQAAYEPILAGQLEAHTLLSVDAIDDKLVEVVYSIQLGPGAIEIELTDALRAVPGTQRVTLLPARAQV